MSQEKILEFFKQNPKRYFTINEIKQHFIEDGKNSLNKKCNKLNEYGFLDFTYIKQKHLFYKAFKLKEK